MASAGYSSTVLMSANDASISWSCVEMHSLTVPSRPAMAVDTIVFLSVTLQTALLMVMSSAVSVRPRPRSVS